MKSSSAAELWAREEFSGASFGDSRRTARFVKMLGRAAERPGGALCDVFRIAKELDGAYDFVENDNVLVSDLEAAVGNAAARACAGDARVRVAIDGSSLSLTDGDGSKFGPIGSIRDHGRGLKVISSLAISSDGVPIGILAQEWWARRDAPRRTRKQTKRDRMRKKPAEKETSHWLKNIERSAARLETAGARAWFQLDREADAWPMLTTLAQTGHWFTVRSAWNRLLKKTGPDKEYLRTRMEAAPLLGSYEIDVPDRGRRRQARRARMEIRAMKLTLVLREKMNGKRPRPFEVTVVWTREQGTTPDGEKPIDWMLLTSAPVGSLHEAHDVIEAYAMRWRIEEFHRTWKSGGCAVETTQLRSRNAVVRWATILAVVATRVERLKRLAREEPRRPSSDELSPLELELLIALKRRDKKRTETVPDGVPDMEQAVRWIADLGGYTGKSSGGPPGSITIRRGLERLRHGVEAVKAMRREQR